MNLRERNALIWMISLSGIAIILVLDLLLLPPAVQRYNQLWNMRSLVSEKSGEEALASRNASEVREAIALLEKDLEQKQQEIEKARFQSKGESEIPQFIESIQKMFSGPGLKLQQIAYQSKVRGNGFLTFPFDSSVEATFVGLRTLVKSIMEHPAAIHIDQFEFLRLDNELHLIHVKIRCSARFREKA